MILATKHDQKQDTIASNNGYEWNICWLMILTHSHAPNLEMN